MIPSTPQNAPGSVGSLPREVAYPLSTGLPVCIWKLQNPGLPSRDENGRLAGDLATLLANMGGPVPAMTARNFLAVSLKCCTGSSVRGHCLTIILLDFSYMVLTATLITLKITQLGIGVESYHCSISNYHRTTLVRSMSQSSGL